MKHPKGFLIVLLILLTSIFIAYKSGKKKSLKNNKLLINDIEFIGLIKSYKISWNHGFTIISVDILKSNASTFNADLKDKLFPYTLKSGKAEIYTILGERSKEIGDTIKVISNKRLLILNLKDGKKDTIRIQMITEKPDISFITKNTSLK